MGVLGLGTSMLQAQLIQHVQSPEFGPLCHTKKIISNEHLSNLYLCLQDGKHTYLDMCVIVLQKNLN